MFMNEIVTLKDSPFVTAFARHETFHFRYGWLKKGIDAVAEDPQMFSRADALY